MMNYRKGLQSLMMVVLLVSIGMLSAEARKSVSSTDQQQWEALQEQVVLISIAKNYANAERLARQSLALAERALGADHLNTGISLSNLAEVLQVQDRYAFWGRYFLRTFDLHSY